jgi:hypothetical protein
LPIGFQGDLAAQGRQLLGRRCTVRRDRQIALQTQGRRTAVQRAQIESPPHGDQGLLAIPRALHAHRRRPTPAARGQLRLQVDAAEAQGVAQAVERLRITPRQPASQIRQGDMPCIPGPRHRVAHRHLQRQVLLAGRTQTDLPRKVGLRALRQHIRQVQMGHVGRGLPHGPGHERGHLGLHTGLLRCRPRLGAPVQARVRVQLRHRPADRQLDLAAPLLGRRA